ncbi:MAG: helicase, partial [Frankia sp.]
VLGGVGAAGGGFVDAGTLAARYGGAGRSGPGNAVEHAAGDRDWAFGHVVVDEAQDLSPMAWRCLVRRCPSRSMTVVGDLAQAGRAWSPSTWKEVLEDTAPGQWRVEELTIGYRTPAEVMVIAGDVLERVDPSLVPPRAIRTAGVPARVRPVPAGRPVAEAVLTAVTDERGALGEGQIAVLTPDPRTADALRAALTGELPGRVAPAAAPEPGAEVVVLPVAAGKGLEFDAVILVDPAAVLASGPRGGNDLYVALTRTTNRLLVLCPGAVPDVLARLTPG